MAATPFSFAGPASVSETAGKATYTVTCGDADTLVPGVTVPNAGVLLVSTADGPAPNATGGADYGALSAVPFTCPPAGATTVDVPITNDTVDEGNEKFTVTITGVLTAVGGLPPITNVNTSVTTTIIDDEPIASIAPVAFIIEGDSGTTAVDLAVTLLSPAFETTTIAFATEDFTAEAGSDYTQTNGNLVFEPGDVTKTVTVPVIGDTVPEGPEAFFLNLTGIDKGSLKTTAKQGGVGIFDNDKAPLPTVTLPKSVSIEEGNGGTGNLLFTVNLSAAATERTEVKWKTEPFTADKADYVSANGTLVFQKGQRTKTISVDVKGDRRDEPDEAFVVLLTSAPNATLGQKGSFGIIEDDDGPKMRIGKPRVRGKNLVAKVTCPKSASRCRGKLVGKAGKLKLGRQRFDLQASDAQKLKLRMSKKARKKLKKRALKAKLRATAADAEGDSRVTKRKARLKRRR